MHIEDSSRLRFEMMTEQDADLLFQLDQDKEVMRYINGGKLTTRDEIQDYYIPRMKSYTNPLKGWGLWKVLIKDSNEFIGWVLVRPMGFFSDSPEWDNLELGWRFMRESWGKGYATEAAQAIADSLKTQQNVSKFSAIALAENKGSINIMAKLGMQYVKTDVHPDAAGEYDVVFYQVSW